VLNLIHRGRRNRAIPPGIGAIAGKSHCYSSRSA
jgi:hypothetical protein